MWKRDKDDEVDAKALAQINRTKMILLRLSLRLFLAGAALLLVALALLTA